jgi:hypothetical protein
LRHAPSLSLFSYTAEDGRVLWSAVAARLGDRSHSQCRQEFQRMQDEEARPEKSWTAELDAKLLQA